MLEGENASDKKHIGEGREMGKEELDGRREGQVERFGLEDEANKVGERVDHPCNLEIVDETGAKGSDDNLLNGIVRQKGTKI